MFVFTKSPLVPAIPAGIARISSPNDVVCYVTGALDYGGFLMQRTYVGKGPARYRRDPAPAGRLNAPLWEVFDQFVPHYQPVLNVAALEYERLAYAPVAEWGAIHGLNIFNHPVYAPFCLQWGNNRELKKVTRIEDYEAIGYAPSVYFSAETEWPAGDTLYKLESSLRDDDPLLQDLLAHAGLHALDGRGPRRQLGFGTWSGACARRVVAAHQREWVWQQRLSVYSVTGHFPKAAERAPMTWYFAQAEMARAWYDLLPTAPPQEAVVAAGACAYLHSNQSLVNCFLDTQLTASKWLPANWDGAEPPITGALLADAIDAGTPGSALTALERPLETPILTVAELLDEQGLPLRVLADQLGTTPATLHRRALQPGTWTVAELQRVAELTQRSLSELAALLADEQAKWPAEERLPVGR